MEAASVPRRWLPPPHLKKIDCRRVLDPDPKGSKLGCWIQTHRIRIRPERTPPDPSLRVPVLVDLLGPGGELADTVLHPQTQTFDSQAATHTYITGG